MTTIRGLHSCQSKNTPYTGDVKTFLVQELPSRNNPDKTWTKIKSASQNDGGRPYEIMSVAKTDYTDAHGNVSFNLEIVPVEISDKRTEPARPLPDGAVRVPAQNGYEDRGNRIERQHSQHMAILYCQITGWKPKDKPTEELRAMIDWFQRDVSRVPAPPKKAKARLEDPNTYPPEEDEAAPVDSNYSTEEEF